MVASERNDKIFNIDTQPILQSTKNCFLPTWCLPRMDVKPRPLIEHQNRNHNQKRNASVDNLLILVTDTAKL